MFLISWISLLMKTSCSPRLSGLTMLEVFVVPRALTLNLRAGTFMVWTGTIAIPSLVAAPLIRKQPRKHAAGLAQEEEAPRVTESPFALRRSRIYSRSTAHTSVSVILPRYLCLDFFSLPSSSKTTILILRSTL